MTLCQAKGCTNEPVPGDDLCGYHQEESEDREIVRKTPSKLGRPINTDSIEEKAAKWDAHLARLRGYKRKSALTKAQKRAEAAAIREQVMAQAEARKKAEANWPSSRLRAAS